MKKLLSGLAALLLAIQCAPISAFANDKITVAVEASVSVNPILGAEKAEYEVKAETKGFTLKLPKLFEPVSEVYTTVESAAAVLREGLKNREEVINITYKVPIVVNENDKYEEPIFPISEIVDEVFSHTGKPDEGDYIMWQTNEVGVAAGKWEATGDPNTGYWTATLPFTAVYYSTLAEEQAVDKKVDEILADIIKDGMSDYDKIEAIYDKCTDVVYDNAHLSDTNYLTQYTAYGAMINGTSVCQGYANMFYRLALEVGIDARIVTGTADGGTGEWENHAWNIVELDGVYYNLDSTWDATYKKNNQPYKYFLKGNGFDTDHKTDATTHGADFYTEHRRSATDYVVKTTAATPVIGTQPIGASYEQNASATPLTVAATVSDGGTLSYVWCMSDSENGEYEEVGYSASYTPSTAAVGEKWYYVEVCNYNEGAEIQYASAYSNKVKVTVTLPDYDKKDVDKAAAEISGGAITVEYGSTEDEVKIAVENYVKSELEKKSIEGVTVSAALKEASDNQYTYTVIYTKGEATATANITMTVNVSADPDIAAVDTAYTAVNALTFDAVPMNTANTEDSVKAIILAKAEEAAGDKVNVTVTKVSFTAAVAGSAATTNAGTAGKYEFTITVSPKTEGSTVPAETTETKTVAIAANKYDGVLDSEAVEAAVAAVVDGEVDVNFGATQADKTAAVKKYVEDALENIANAKDVEVTVVYNTATEKYDVTFKKASKSDTKSLTMTMNVSADPDIAVVEAALKAANEAVYPTTVTQQDCPDWPSLSAKLRSVAVNAINDNSLDSVIVSFESQTLAQKGTAADPDGTNGTATFLIEITKGQQRKTTDLKSVTITATPFDGTSDKQAVENAKSVVVNGEIDVEYGTTQTQITEKVKVYVQKLLDETDKDVEGVSFEVTLKDGTVNEYTVKLQKNAEQTEKVITMTVNVSADPDIAAVDTAYTAVNALTFDAVPMNTANTEDSVKAIILAKAEEAAGDKVKITVTKVSFTAAVAGSAATTNAGTAGKYEFTITVSPKTEGSAVSAKTTETKTVAITANKYDGVLDSEAVEAAVAAVVDGEVDVNFGATQADKTAAVKKYVEDALEAVANADGVEVTVVYNTATEKYDVTFKKDSATAKKSLAMTVNEAADPDIALVDTAYSAVNAITFEAIPMNTANTEDSVKAIILAKAEEAAGDKVKITVTKVSFTAAVAGSAATTNAGTAGKYEFTITVSPKTEGSTVSAKTTETKTVAIAANKYDGVLDSEAVEAAKKALVDGEIVVKAGATDAEKRKAVEEHLNKLLSGDAAGVKLTIESVSGDKYTVKLEKGDVSDTKTVTLTLRDDSIKLQAPTELTYANGIAKWNKVEGATKYILKLYRVPSVLAGTLEINNNSVKLGRYLEKDMLYAFTVTAVGDGVKYLTSDESKQSKIFSRDTMFDDWYMMISQLYNRRYTVKAVAGEGGKITPAGNSIVRFNKSISFKITPDKDYEISAVYVNGENIGTDAEFTISNIRKNYVVKVEFEKIEWKNPFIDVSKRDSYYDAVKFVNERGLFEGVTSNRFGPDVTMTRAMFVTVLGRLEGVDTSKFKGTSFTDAKAGQWYSPYVQWAAKEGIIKGYGNGRFGVDDEITVEQAAVIVARYADYVGIRVGAGIKLDHYTDSDEIADWAIDQMKWIVSEDIYVGEGKKLNPKEDAPRYLIAEMLYTFIEKFGE